MTAFKEGEVDIHIGKITFMPTEFEREEYLRTLHPEFMPDRPHTVDHYTDEGYFEYRKKLITILATMKGDEVDENGTPDFKGYGTDLYCIKRQIAVIVTDRRNEAYPNQTEPTRNYEDIKVPGIALIYTYRQGRKYFYVIHHETQSNHYGGEQFESRQEAIGRAIERLVMIERGV